MPSKEELVSKLAQALDSVPSVRYALGGAEAMAAHGYSRHTDDLDVFVLEDDLNKLMHALRKTGLETFSVFEPFHYAARILGATVRTSNRPASSLRSLGPSWGSRPRSF
ncbi:MAG: hypothetical protein NUW37_01680 [Planctomycetes bacterium]|nr:hypothetical protein [Planctomycetota bacterium]